MAKIYTYKNISETPQVISNGESGDKLIRFSVDPGNLVDFPVEVNDKNFELVEQREEDD